MAEATMLDRALSWRVEEVCFNAFPSLRQVLLDNWLLRFSSGVSRRGNSANLLRPEPGDIAAAIQAIEAIYRGQKQPTIFRMLSILDPRIDHALADRGYTREGETCVLHGPRDGVSAKLDREVRLLPTPSDEWLTAMARLQGQSAAQAETYRGIVRRIAVPARFAMLSVDGTPAALAFGALHAGLLCYESVITDPDFRRQGLSRRVVGALAAWACDEGATGVCLQVDTANTPARALYQRFGLTTELHHYHYRREPAAL